MLRARRGQLPPLAPSADAHAITAYRPHPVAENLLPLVTALSVILSETVEPCIFPFCHFSSLESNAIDTLPAETFSGAQMLRTL